MKKLIKPEDFVHESLVRMAAAHPDLLKVEFDPKFVYRADAPVQGKVAIISGGAVVMNRCMLGLSGWGMLDAAWRGFHFSYP